MIKAVFSASLLQSSVSHDPSEIILIYWFGPQETFLIIINAENCLYCLIFLWKQTESPKQHLFTIEIFCNLINVFTVTFDQFNASLLNKGYNLTTKKNLTDPKHF